MKKTMVIGLGSLLLGFGVIGLPRAAWAQDQDQEVEVAPPPPPAPDTATTPAPAPAPPPPAPGPTPQPAPAPQNVYNYPTGSWVYAAEMGWVWVPAGATTTAVEGVPYTYLYTPSVGWTWYISPWGFGRYAYGPWVQHPWRPVVGWRGGWVAHPRIVGRLGGPRFGGPRFGAPRFYHRR